MKLVKLLANLGYGSRKDVQRWIRAGAVTDDTGRVLAEHELPPHESIRFRGEPLELHAAERRGKRRAEIGEDRDACGRVGQSRLQPQLDAPRPNERRRQVADVHRRHCRTRVPRGDRWKLPHAAGRACDG